MPFGTTSYDNGIPYTQKFDYSGGTSVIYIGWADRGSLTSAKKWKIQKLMYDINGNVTDIQWASMMFDQVWDNRASLTYS